MAKISQAPVPSIRSLVCPSYSKKAVAMVTRTTKARPRASKYKIEKSAKKKTEGKGSAKGRNGKEYKRKREGSQRGKA